MILTEHYICQDTSRLLEDIYYSNDFYSLVKFHGINIESDKLKLDLTYRISKNNYILELSFYLVIY